MPTLAMNVRNEEQPASGTAHGAARLRSDMVSIAGREFFMGSDDFYPEEKPARRVRVSGFAIDHHPVTNRAFASFVDATG